MTSRKKTALCAGIGLTTLLVVVNLHAQQRKPVDEKALREASSGSEWLTYGRDYSETRFSPLKQINASNVAQLGLTMCGSARWKQHRWCGTESFTQPKLWCSVCLRSADQ